MTKRILHIDDDVDDHEMLQDALLGLSPAVQVAFARDGRAGVDYLQRAKEENALPHLVVLDINMPIMDGKKTLEIIRADSYFDNLPVVVFTSGNNKLDVGYFTSRNIEVISKPHTNSALNSIAKRLLDYVLTEK